jgi:hypothetical protein
MCYTIAIGLISLWLVGLVTNFTLGGFIDLLLIAGLLLALGNLFWRAKRAPATGAKEAGGQ